jgi:hypothetical protein
MHPLENPRRVRFVWGYHPYVPPPDDAAANGLDGRFAVVLEAWPHYAPGSLVDTNLFFTLVRAVVETVPHDAVRIRLTDGSVRTRLTDDTEDQVLDSLLDFEQFDLGWHRHEQCDYLHGHLSLYDAGRLTCLAEPELWFDHGGPCWYHDSYTLSFYAPVETTARLRDVCFAACDRVGALVTGYSTGTAVYEPKTPKSWLARVWSRCVG